MEEFRGLGQSQIPDFFYYYNPRSAQALGYKSHCECHCLYGPKSCFCLAAGAVDRHDPQELPPADRALPPALARAARPRALPARLHDEGVPGRARARRDAQDHWPLRTHWPAAGD